MSSSKFMTAAQAARLIRDGDTVGLMGGGGGLMEATCLFEAVQARFPRLEFIAHFHNTRGMGLVNAVAAVQAGIRRFDTSLGGIGGCPYAPGATGNVATEDMVHLFDCMGYDTGMDLPGLLGAAATLRRLK